LERYYNFTVEEGCQSPYDIFGSDYETYFNSRSNSFKKNCRRAENRLNSAGSFRLLRIEKYNEFEEYFDDLIDISSQSWKKETKTDLKSMPHMAQFYKDYCRLTSDNNLFVLFVLLIDEIPVAFDFCLKFNNCLVGLRSDFNEKYRRYLPGVYIHCQTIKGMFQDELPWEFDCSGAKSEYKMSLVGKLRRHLNITIARPDLLGNFALSVKKILMRANGRPLLL
jgi:CelD/BcsL family acetyltransferase involved in cellulose biosynthesis